MPELRAIVIQRTSLRDQALDVVRQALISGQVLPGEIYSAAALANKLGMSNSPVREAMLTLVNQGLMEVVRNRGFRVIPMSPEDMDEIYELRVMLEVPAIGELASTELGTELARFFDLASEIEAAADVRDIPRILEIDRMFHMGLLELSGNRRRCVMVANLRDQTRLYGLGDLVERGSLGESLAEHTAILRAIEAREPDCAQDLMRKHLDHVRGDWAAPQGHK